MRTNCCWKYGLFVYDSLFEQQLPGYFTYAFEACEAWGKARTDWVLPRVTLTAAESSATATIEADITTYFTE